jgi:hypothetical protein
MTPQISIHEEPEEAAKTPEASTERRDSGGPVSSDDDGEMRRLVETTPKE